MLQNNLPIQRNHKLRDVLKVKEKFDDEQDEELKDDEDCFQKTVT